MNSDELRKLYDEGGLTPEQFFAKLFESEEADRLRRSKVENVEAIKGEDLRAFTIKKPNVPNIIALRMSLYDTTITSELRRMAKYHGAVENVKAMSEDDERILSNEVRRLCDEYETLSRNKRKKLLRKFYEEVPSNDEIRTFAKR